MTPSHARLLANVFFRNTLSLRLAARLSEFRCRRRHRRRRGAVAAAAGFAAFGLRRLDRLNSLRRRLPLATNTSRRRESQNDPRPERASVIVGQESQVYTFSRAAFRIQPYKEYAPRRFIADYATIHVRPIAFCSRATLRCCFLYFSVPLSFSFFPLSPSADVVRADTSAISEHQVSRNGRTDACNSVGLFVPAPARAAAASATTTREGMRDATGRCNTSFHSSLIIVPKPYEEGCLYAHCPHV